MKRRLTAIAVAALALSSLLAASLPRTAGAAGTGLGSATARAAQTDAGTTKVTASVCLLANCNLGALTELVTSTLVNPLVNLPQRMTTALSDSLTGSGLSASNGSTQQSRPAAGGYPMCNQGGWTTSNCFGPALPNVSQPGLITLTTGGVQGYATGDENGFAAATHVADPTLTLFGVTIGDLGVVDSSSSCTTSACSATHALTGGSLFNGGLTYSLAGNNVLAQVGSTAVTAAPIKVVDGVTASLTDNLLSINIALTLTQLLGGIGTTLSALGGALGGVLNDAATTATLSLTIGPGQVSANSNTSSSAWGLNVGVSLAADIKLKLTAANLVKIADIGVIVGQATAGSPDLTNLRLAYSATTAGSGGGPGDPGGGLLPGWVPPALI